MSTSQQLVLVILFWSALFVRASSPQTTWGEDPQFELHSAAEVSSAGQQVAVDGSRQQATDGSAKAEQAHVKQRTAPNVAKEADAANSADGTRAQHAPPKQPATREAAKTQQIGPKQRTSVQAANVEQSSASLPRIEQQQHSKNLFSRKRQNQLFKSALQGSPKQLDRESVETAKDTDEAAKRKVAILKHQEQAALATIGRLEFWMTLFVLGWLLFVFVLAACKCNTWMMRGHSSLQEPLLHVDANEFEGKQSAVWLAAYCAPEEDPEEKNRLRQLMEQTMLAEQEAQREAAAKQQAEMLAAALMAAQEAKEEVEKASARATQAEQERAETRHQVEQERAAALAASKMLSLTQQQFKTAQQREKELKKQLEQATLAEQSARKNAADARNKAAQTSAGLAQAQLSAALAQQEAEKAMARAAQAEASANQEKAEAWTTARTLSLTKKQMKAAHQNEEVLKKQVEQALAAEAQARKVAAEEQATALAVAAEARATAQREADEAALRAAEAEAKLSMAKTMSEQEPSTNLMAARMEELKMEVQEALSAEQRAREAEQSKSLTAAEQALAAALREAEASSAIASQALENLAEFKAKASQEKEEAQTTAKILSLTKKQLKAADETERDLKQQLEQALLAEKQARAAVAAARNQTMQATSGYIIAQAGAPDVSNRSVARTSGNWLQNAVGPVRMTTPIAEKSPACGTVQVPCFRMSSAQLSVTPVVMGA